MRIVRSSIIVNQIIQVIKLVSKQNSVTSQYYTQQPTDITIIVKTLGGEMVGREPGDIRNLDSGYSRELIQLIDISLPQVRIHKSKICIKIFVNINFNKYG